MKVILKTERWRKLTLRATTSWLGKQLDTMEALARLQEMAELTRVGEAVDPPHSRRSTLH